jgi:hypothetical protein
VLLMIRRNGSGESIGDAEVYLVHGTRRRSSSKKFVITFSVGDGVYR